MTATIDNELNTARAVARYVRISPMKARRIIDLIRGQKAVDVMSMLEFAPQAASTPVRKVVQSAVANAENTLEVSSDELWVAAAYVDQGPTLKRWRPRAQGRPARIFKRTSHITVIVEHRPEADSQSGTSKRNRRTR